jgi:Zn-dependent protease
MTVLALALDPNTLALGPLWFVVFLLSLTCHEASHALVAKWGGDPTAFHGGQVTLDPRPHIRREPFGTIIVPIASYLLSGWMMGWASAPYDPFWQQRHPRRAALMALAGPLGNLSLVLVATLAIHTGILAGVFAAPVRASFTHLVDSVGSAHLQGVGTFMSILFSLNLLLAAFNLLPVPPLDGISVITLFMSEDQARRFSDWSRNPSFTFVGILLAWKVFDYIFNPLFLFGLKLLYPMESYG